MGFASESRERSRPVIPLAGMVDILFLLLIFFMSTYTMRDQELTVDVGLPTSETATTGQAEAMKVIVSFDEDGRVFVGEREAKLVKQQPDDELLVERLQQLADISRDQPVIIRGDARGRYGLLLEIMDAAELAGLTDVKLAVVREE
ncbi:MAG: biopolymer transporter ExbD [Planctomycetota bacterium]